MIFYVHVLHVWNGIFFFLSLIAAAVLLSWLIFLPQLVASLAHCEKRGEALVR